MKPALDYSKKIRTKLAEGRTLDAALGELRAEGASIFDCIVSVRALHNCEIIEAKRIVETSDAWSNRRVMNEEMIRELTDSN